MIQVEIERQIGEATRDGHRMCGWARYDYEFFERCDLARARIAELERQGVNAKLGKLSRRLSNGAE